ncbi:hypothetical protein ASE95_15920 [Sphingomonas sp. Leaf231]|uniref:helix-turn-helix domain-containing protein n=1 Tax=Sphingomonas sp. Leaf231 TaxID=1736301 RepID=UPI0006FA8A6E|nr:helix-turn-helix transcriptional regulator [Sphingomonas sp. Leaf231]KQN90174.1 hypothetical protein ASE95_15920 [Sphingomonas sp. Leaf231]
MLDLVQTIDAYRLLVFPNRIRECRRAATIGTLMELSDRVPNIPYIRLSKIERGEIFARTEELVEIAAALRVSPLDLLHDVTDPSFDIADWAAENAGLMAVDPEVDHQSVALAAALRVRREADSAMTIGAIERLYGIAPVVLSRIEHAVKPWPRWNTDTMSALCGIFDVSDTAALHAKVAALQRAGQLVDAIAAAFHPRVRIGKSSARIAELRRQLSAGASSPPAPREERRSRVPGPPATSLRQPRVVPVFGTPLPDGLIARVAVDEQKVEVPSNAGPSSYGLRICRPTLGLGMPANAIVIVDPDRFPGPGGLAIAEEEKGFRLVAVSVNRNGRMVGYVSNSEREVKLDDIDPSSVAAVIAAIL